jgi:hypothetical protein
MTDGNLTKAMTGRDAEGVLPKDLDHFGNCPVCGARVDMRDLVQLLEHVHRQVIDMRVGDEPPQILQRWLQS